MSTPPPEKEGEDEEAPCTSEQESRSTESPVEQSEAALPDMEGSRESPISEEESPSVHQASRIIILEERDIPFEEERPPNFSPYFEVKVKQVRRPEKPKEVKP